MVVSTQVAHRIPAGWYPDRDDRSRRRWWDGEEWTDHYSAAPEPNIRRVAPIEVQQQPHFRDVDTSSTPHTLSRALRFSDRVPAFILLGLAAANLLLLGFLVRFL
jgi:hypothetical protein